MRLRLGCRLSTGCGIPMSSGRRSSECVTGWSDYAYVDLDVVWEAAVRDVPELADRLRSEKGDV